MLLPNVPLIHIMLISQVANGILLPFILIFMVLLINNKRLMGEHVNSKFDNFVCWMVVAVMIILSTFLFITAFIH